MVKGTFFTFKKVAYNYRGDLLLEDDYIFILSSKVKVCKETNKGERGIHYIIPQSS